MLLMQSWSSVSCADCSVHCGMFQWAIMARQNYQKPTLNCSDRSRFFISKPSGYWDWHDLCRGPPLPASRLSPRRNWFTRERAGEWCQYYDRARCWDDIKQTNKPLYLQMYFYFRSLPRIAFVSILQSGKYSGLKKYVNTYGYLCNS